MKIDVFYTPLGLNAGDLTGRAVVVIDVLRATSTIVTALAAGAKAIVPAASSEEVVRLTANLEKNGIVLAGNGESSRPRVQSPRRSGRGSGRRSYSSISPAGVSVNPHAPK